ncbi:MAG: endonuclease MutS2 [Tissierellia bacterium]|nr:endonuclease MutS2 [Tissierellia bacterium]
MNKKALDVLEYKIVLDKLINHSSSSLGKEKALELTPLSDIDEIKRLQDETEEAYKLIIKVGSPSIYGVTNLKAELKHVEKGGIMLPRKLLEVSDNLRSAKAMINYLGNTEENIKNYPQLSKYVNALYKNTNLENDINIAIISEDEISDNASRNLSRIRRAQKNKTQGIRDKLNGIIRSQSNALQDNIITVRDGRYVVPVKSEKRGLVKGIVHDQSSSGATVFIEPMSVVQLNNELRILESEENEEIRNILRDLSLKALEISEELLLNQEILTDLDLIFAKGKLAIEMDAIKPKLNNQGYFNFKKARHPAIDKKKVVPIDIYIGDDYNTLVITGPNTGGKTVTLKTVGLITLMAQTGLHIPCDFGSTVAVFDEIFADIGDEQSIEQSLSTFSSHMTNIVKILENVKDNSLVLFDELGAGTDPTEGAALAMAILKRLLDKNIRTIATTHYSQLKLFALTTDKVKNGAVEFDVDTLSPTYRLHIGVPGKSNAFEISKRLGLDDEIIEESRVFISQENQSFEDVLQQIESDRKRIEESKMEQELLERTISNLKEELEKEIEKNKKSREKIVEKAKDEAFDILNEAKETASDLIKELKFMKAVSSIDEDVQSKVNKLEKDVNKKLNKYETKSSGIKTKVSKQSKEIKDIDIGDDVEILGIGQEGEVATKPDKKGNLLVQVGIMKINANIKNLRLIKSKESKTAETNIKSIIKNKANQNISQEIDLRGMSIEEAILEIDKYLDDAYIIGVKEVQLIHGKGTGVLRKGVQNYLKKHKHVKSFRIGGYSEGGMGVTVVQLK